MTMAEAKQKMLAGPRPYFFTKETMRFWNSKVETPLFANRCFVTSEDSFDRSRKLYTVRRFSEDYTDIVDIGEFQAYNSKAAAVDAAKLYRE